MKRTQRRLWLSRWLTALLLCFIWGNSMLPGSLSGAISDWVRGALSLLLPMEVPGVTSGGGLLRKIAHFSEFAALGICLSWQLGMLEKRKSFALLPGFMAACVDETIQCFVPERGPSLWDVAIDTCGVAAGMVLLILGHHFIQRIKQLKENKRL